MTASTPQSGKPAWRSWHLTATAAVRRLGDTNFGRLARVHGVMVMGDATITIALAGSLFFSIDPGAARWRVALYLLFTMAPFALVAPLVGPALDRTPGGRRMMIIASGALRALVAMMMIGDLDSLLLFPEAFAMLVLGKAYHVAKSALVPTTVETDEELVEANSKLAVISALAGIAAAVPAGLLILIGGPEAVVGLAMIVFIVATGLAIRLPKVAVAEESVDDLERSELRSAGILLAATSMGALRWIVGFVAFLLAFDLRGGSRQRAPAELLGDAMKRIADPEAASLSLGKPTWYFGAVLGVSALAGMLGSWIAPRLRSRMREESMLTASLLTVAAGALFASVVDVSLLVSAMLVATVVGISASSGKQGFDAIVQRDAPDANRGRSFASFEARFQVVWVVGAFIPVLLHIPARLGYFVVAVVAAGAAGWYLLGGRISEFFGDRRASRAEPAGRPVGSAPEDDPPGGPVGSAPEDDPPGGPAGSAPEDDPVADPPQPWPPDPPAAPRQQNGRRTPEIRPIPEPERRSP